jgi:hypothetical protein
MAAQALPRREMQLFVKLLDGRTRGFQLGRSEPLHTVKRQLEKSEGVCVADQRLIWAGHQLDDHATPDDAEMHSGATVHFALRLRGGLFVETLELLWSLIKTILGLIRDLWNYLFGKCCGGKCRCKVEDDEDETDGSSYDDLSESSSDDDEDDEAKKKRKEERMKRKMAHQAEWGPVWVPPKECPPLPDVPNAENLRVHRSLFNPTDGGKWRVAPFGQHSAAILDAKPVNESRPAEESALSVVVVADEPLVPSSPASAAELSGAYFSEAMELEAFLVEDVGIVTGAGDYAARLIEAGVSTAEAFAEVPVEDLHKEPYLFRDTHVAKVKAFRNGGDDPEGGAAEAPGVVMSP